MTSIRALLATLFLTLTFVSSAQAVTAFLWAYDGPCAICLFSSSIAKMPWRSWSRRWLVSVRLEPRQRLSFGLGRPRSGTVERSTVILIHKVVLRNISRWSRDHSVREEVS